MVISGVIWVLLGTDTELQSLTRAGEEHIFLFVKAVHSKHKIRSVELEIERRVYLRPVDPVAFY